jgi:hypothetical protein
VRIASVDIQLQSEHQQTTRVTQTEQLQAWIGSPPGTSQAPPSPSFAVDLSQLGSDTLAAEAQAAQATATDAGASPELQLLKTIIERMLGVKIDLLSADDLQPAVQPADIPDPAQATAQSRQPLGWGVEYHRHTTYDEQEQLHFSAQGEIRTTDGAQIEFSIDLSLSRAYHEESDVELRAGDAQRRDPLVINFDGTGAQLSSTRFAFDIDADGRSENIPLLASGSGYLALDRNGDGKINSGAELLGARSGDGFADLSAQDSDGNGWIDENDSLYDQLRVWSPDSNGGGTLETLKQRNVGAVSVGRVATPFELRAADKSLGGVRTSGLYLTEDGHAGSVQQIDLSV